MTIWLSRNQSNNNYFNYSSCSTSAQTFK